jgi:hypothetical protein
MMGAPDAAMTTAAHIVIAVIAIVPGVLAVIARRTQKEQGRVIQEIRITVNGERDRLVVENARLQEELTEALMREP